MKILVFTSYFGKTTQTFIHNEIYELDRRHDVKVICLFRENEERYPFPNLEVINFPESFIGKKIRGRLKKHDLSLSLKNAGFAKQLNKIVSDFQPDIIHAHFGDKCFYILDNLDNQEIPIFVSFHGYDASWQLNLKVYRKRLSSIFKEDRIHPIFVSNFMLNNVKSSGVTVNQFNILYYGTDISRFNRKNKDNPKDPFIILQVSSFQPKKGHEFTVAAFAKMIHRGVQNVKLVLAGYGPLEDEVKAQVKDLSIENYVEFPGKLTHEETQQMMEKAHAFIHHSVVDEDGNMEGIPNAIMESMAMELPVLSTYHSGIPELVGHEVNGYLVKEKDVDDLSEKMEAILAWNYLPENRKKVAALFEKTKHGELLTGFYQQAINSKTEHV